METAPTLARYDKKSAALPEKLIRHSLKHSGSHRSCTNFNSLLGLTRVSHKFYEGARHEVLNETNRDEVTRDVLDWLKTVV